VLKRALLLLAELLGANVSADVDLDGAAHGDFSVEEEAVDAFERQTGDLGTLMVREVSVGDREVVRRLWGVKVKVR
jgi:hypothetical protein